MSVLKKIRVVEFAEGVPGPLAALRLSDLGAEVIKVELPEGDWLRNAAPSLPNNEMSAAFFELNRGKRSVVPGDKLSLSALLKNADVFITDRTTAQLAALGVTGIEAEPYAANPKLVGRAHRIAKELFDLGRFDLFFDFCGISAEALGDLHRAVLAHTATGLEELLVKF